MALKYSVYYRIQQRDDYFKRFFKRFSKQFSAEIKEAAEEKYEELMEIIVKYILDENKTDLNILLTKQNAKVARMFFDYLTVSNIKNKKKCEIAKRIDEVFLEDKIMIDFKSFLAEKLTPIDLSEELKDEGKLILTEEDDPFGDDAGGDDDMGGDDAGGDPFGDDDMGGDEGSDGETDAEGEEGEDSENESEDELDLEGHEDDPDFTQGVTNSDDITLSDTPAGETIYDVDGIMKSISSVIQSTSDNDLAEIVAVKKAVELIFNGKILNPEDVTFQNPQNAAFLIKKIGENVDEKTKNYMMIKIKEPLIKQRDQQKLDIAALKKDVNTARDTIQDLDQA